MSIHCYVKIGITTCSVFSFCVCDFLLECENGECCEAVALL